jgi:hypothetical protein
MISNGPAVVSYVSLLKTILILAWLWLKSAKLWPATVPSEHGKSKISMA